MNIEWTGDDIAPFAKAFIAAQKATEAIKKASSNPHFKSRYADLASVVEAVVPALNEHGVGVMQFPSNSPEGVCITTVLIHESGARVSSSLTMTPTKNDPQGVGSAITYARRYALLSIAGAAPEDDDGNQASSPPSRTAWPKPVETKPEPVKLINEDQMMQLEELITETDTDLVKFKTFYKIDRLSLLPADKFDAAMAFLMKKRIVA